MGMILRIASSRIVGQGDIVGRSGYFSLNLSANSVMRGRLDARRTLKSLVADLRVVYYSWSGNTEAVARLIQSETKADLFEIELQNPYPANYSACVDEYRADKRENRVRPLKSKVENIAGYDIIFLGSPIWSGTIAPPVKTFLSGHDLSGKRIIPFVTHGGGGAGSSFTDMKKLAPRAEFSKGLSLYGSRSGFDGEVKKWLKQMEVEK